MPRRSKALALALCLAAAIALVTPRAAGAGDYVVTQCSTVEPTAGQAAWEQSGAGYRSRDRCGTDDGLQAFHDAAESRLGEYGAWVWSAPAGTVFTSVQANASLTSQAGHQGRLVATSTTGTILGLGTEHNDFRVHAATGEFSRFAAWLGCAAPGPGRPCGHAGGDSAHAYVRGVYLRTADREAPAVTLGGSSLLDHPVVRGIRGLSFDAADAGGGVRRVEVEANGTVLVTDVRNCAVAAGFATALSPCPASTSEAAAVPTAGPGFVTGPNLVSACAEDLALDGPANRTCERRWVWVDNACPSSTPSGATGLEASFAGKPSTLVRSDRAASIHGRLSGAGAGATVCALTRVAMPGAPIVVAATATTSADGAFEIELPPGPGREVFVHHAVGDLVAARHGLAVRSSARPSLRVTPRRRLGNGSRLRFGGRLPAPACDSRVVKVQARLGARRWQVFRTGRTDGGCRFAAAYRLRHTSGARRYRFRATVPAQAGYPFERGSSAIVAVWVRRR